MLGGGERVEGETTIFGEVAGEFGGGVRTLRGQEASKGEGEG